MTLRVGIIGAGGRIKKTVLPAIWVLGDRAEIIQINTRTPQDVDLPDGSCMSTATSLDELPLESVDVLIIAVGTNSVSPVLKQLGMKPHKNRVTLVMDTPPLRFSHLWRFNIFKGFGGVAVGEDWVKLSTILAAKRIIASGEIGELRSIRLDHLSYRYHGLAALKELASVNSVTSIRRRSLGNDFFETKVKLRKRVTATTVDPRDYENGRMLITGSGGFISDFNIRVGEKNRFEIQYPETNAGWYQPISINGELQVADEIEQFMAALPFNYLQDDSRINRLKIRGYARLLEDIAGGFVSYPIRRGLYDYLAIVLAERTGRFHDISFSNNRNSLVHRLMGLHR